MQAILKITIRTLLKQKRQLILSLLSLSLSLAIVVLTSGYIASELSCDKHHANFERTYRLVNTTFNEVGLEDKLYDKLINNLPQVDKACRFFKAHSMLSIDEKVINIDNLVIVDSTFFEIFDYQIISGNVEHLLDAPNKIVLSQSLANKLFGNENPIGQEIKINMTATAVVSGMFIENNKSHFSSDAVISLFTQNLPWTGGNYFNDTESWVIKKFSFYITLKERTDTSIFNSQVNAQYVTPWEPEKPNLVLQPLSDIYWNKEIKDYSGHANTPLFFLIISVAVILILIAGINYVNISLSSLQSELKIVGIFKVHGAKNSGIAKYYSYRVFVILVISFILALMLAYAMLPYANELLNAKFSLLILTNMEYLLPFIGLLILVTILIGIYPVITFSRINPLNLFQRKMLGNLKLSNFSKILLVFQFIATIMLIISVIFIFKQLKFMKNTDYGFDMNYLIKQDFHYSIKDKSIIDSYSKELIENPNIYKVSHSTGIPLGIYSWSGQKVNGNKVEFLEMECDTGFINLFKLKILEGRNFLPSDENSCIISKKLSQDCGFKNPLNENIGNRKIIGVVDDMHAEPLHNKIKGLRICLLKDKPSNISIRINSKDLTRTLEFMKTRWERYFPNYPFNYYFYDEIIAEKYNKEQKLSKSISIIASMAMLLCCLGLLGLVFNMVENRTKEIGIRKINGAKTIQIIMMLNKDLLKWVAIAFIIACPIAWYAMNKWLENFAYKTELSWWIFALAGLLAFVVALLTVSWQSWRAAARNPVEALRYE